MTIQKFKELFRGFPVRGSTNISYPYCGWASEILHQLIDGLSRYSQVSTILLVVNSDFAGPSTVDHWALLKESCWTTHHPTTSPKPLWTRAPGQSSGLTCQANGLPPSGAIGRIGEFDSANPRDMMVEWETSSMIPILDILGWISMG